MHLLFALLLQGGTPLELPVDYAARSVVLVHSPPGSSEIYSGTGFLVQLPEALCLVTAEHVATDVGPAPHISFGDANDLLRTVKLSDLTGDAESTWVRHGEADVAVILLDGKAEEVSLLSSRALQPAHLVSQMESPSRDRPLTVFGFPLTLGAFTRGPDRRLSAISRESRAASGLLTFARFDNKKKTNFFLLMDPSIGGYSGAPVFLLAAPFISDQVIGFGPPVGYCIGLVHGTITDETGGKLAAVVPSAYITETIEKAYNQRSR